MSATENLGDLYDDPRKPETVDDKGRTHIAHLSDREIAEETLAHLRSVADAISELSETPMFKAMRTGGNPFMAALRG